MTKTMGLLRELFAAQPDEPGNQPMTKTVTRYELEEVGHYDDEHDHVMFERPYGEWVKYDDIKHLLQVEPGGELIDFADKRLSENRPTEPIDEYQHVMLQGEKGWVFHQSCKCNSCRYVHWQVLAAQSRPAGLPNTAESTASPVHPSGASVRRGLMPVTEVIDEMREIAEDLYLSNKTTQAEDEALEALFDAIAARFP